MLSPLEVTLFSILYWIGAVALAISYLWWRWRASSESVPYNDVERALTIVRKSTARNIPVAVFCFVGGAYFTWRLIEMHLVHKVDGVDLVTYEGLQTLANVVLLLVVGLHHCSGPQPRDQLLMAIAEELGKRAEPGATDNPDGA